MAHRRKVEIFTAGCPACEEVVQRVYQLACPSCEVITLDMKDPQVARRAREMGVRSVPAVAVNGELASCCAGRGVDPEMLRAAGVGQAL